MKFRTPAWWQAQAARFDAANLRGRILMFLAAAACLGVLANWAWLSPAIDANRLLMQRLAQQDVALKTGRADLAAIAHPEATREAVREKLLDVRTRLATGRRTLAALSAVSTVQTTPLAQLLAHLLRRHEGLTLLRTATMNQGAAATSMSAYAIDKTSLPAGLERRGVEMTVAGPYAELTRYVGTLEQALPQVRWGAMQLRSGTGAPELTLHLYLVEVKTP